MTPESISGLSEPVGRTEGSLPWPPMVVIVAYGCEDQLAASLHALGPGLPVVVVDNGGSDRAQRICESSGATYVRPHTNIGFAAAVNVALREYREPGPRRPTAQPGRVFAGHGPHENARRTLPIE